MSVMKLCLITRRMIEISDEIKKIRGCYEDDGFYYDVVNGEKRRLFASK